MKTKDWTKKFCKAMLILFFFAGIADAAIMPVFEDLTSGSVTFMSAPSQVAVSPGGDMYVIEGLRHRVSAYSRKGSPIGSISVQYPSSIAINQNGFIYVGSDQDRSVSIYNSSRVRIGQLGAGANEFLRLRALAINPANGNVLAIDSFAAKIKIYNESGVFINAINMPEGLKVDLTVHNNEIYLINLPSLVGATASTLGSTYWGAKVDVLDMSGALQRSFVSYGMEPGQMITPAGITNDSVGRIYLTDSYQGVVFCFDGLSGAYLGAIHNPALPMVAPIGVDMAADGRLAVVSQRTNTLKIFGIDNYTFLTASPLSLAFTAKEGRGDPASQTVLVGNSGKGVLTYTAVADSPWIVLQNAAGTVQSQGSVAMIVGIDASALTPGSYNGTVTITDNSGAKETIQVSLQLQKAPRLSVSPTQLEYTHEAGSAGPAAQFVDITLSDDASNSTVWTATASSSWLAAGPSAGSGNSVTQAAITINPEGLVAGTYMGTVSVAASDAIGSPAVVSVTLTVRSAGTIAVTTNMAEAGFTITGPVSLTGSGTTWGANSLPAGAYSISYNEIAGYITPPSETKTVAGGTITAFNGTYKIKVVKNIVVSPGYSKDNVSTVRVFGADGIMKQEVIISGPKYDVGFNLAVGDINGDGVDEIITGLGPDPKSQAKVSAADQQGNNLLGATFEAFSTKYGVKVATGNFSGDGKASIIAGSGPAVGNNAQLRIFVYENSMIADSGVNIIPFSTKYGVSVAAGDVDGDGTDELIVAPGPDSTADALVRVLKVNTSGGPGAWSVSDTGVAFTAFAGKYGANVTTADLNYDGKAEIIVTSGSNENVTENRIAAFDGNGQLLGLNIVDDSSGGLEVAAGDIDVDGNVEIVVTPGPKSSNSALVKVYRADGTLVRSFSAFDTSTNGARVSVGKIVIDTSTNGAKVSRGKGK